MMEPVKKVQEKMISSVSTKKKKSIVIICKCTQEKKKFCIRLDKYNYSVAWKLIVAFPYQPQMRSEKYESNSKSFTGKIIISENYNGCPYCESKYLQFCDCGHVFDTRGSGLLTCPWCNKTNNYSPGQLFKFKGGAH